MFSCFFTFLAQFGQSAALSPNAPMFLCYKAGWATFIHLFTSRLILGSSVETAGQCFWPVTAFDVISVTVEALPLHVEAVLPPLFMTFTTYLNCISQNAILRHMAAREAYHLQNHLKAPLEDHSLLFCRLRIPFWRRALFSL
jgi:hypothetical protein